MVSCCSTWRGTRPMRLDSSKPSNLHPKLFHSKQSPCGKAFPSFLQASPCWYARMGIWRPAGSLSLPMKAFLPCWQPSCIHKAQWQTGKQRLTRSGARVNNRTSLATKVYYSFVGQAVAMQVRGTTTKLDYCLTDHLGQWW